jgi:hypothetical protein
MCRSQLSAPAEEDDRLLSVTKGTCYCLFAYDVAWAIDLDAAERSITAFTQRETIRHKRRAPRYFEYRPAPLRVSQDAAPVRIAAGLEVPAQIDLVLYDFGAVGVIYRLPLGDRLADLLQLSELLYDNDALLADARRRVEELVRTISASLSAASISSFVEDYVIFHVEAFGAPRAVQALTRESAQQLAQILRAEPRTLSEDEVTDALSHRISYSDDDLVIVDWNAALVFDSDADDILAVLEFANVELLEMRFLDQRLDDALTQAYERMSRQPKRWLSFKSNPSDLRDISQWQVDSAILFEGVNNALKLLGDQYLARLYRLAGERFHLADWDASILRKLDTLEGIYQKLADRVSTRRMEALEWVIIVLIAVSMVIPFVTGLAPH